MDAESFKKVFLPLHPRLYRVAFALTGNSRDAEDILQDAYCKLWGKREEVILIGNTEAFCVTLVKNLCYDLLRSPRRRQSEEEVEKLWIATESSPETEAIGNDEIRLIRQLIDRLPENQRQVMLLKGIKGCSPEEIEEITGLSAINVRVLLSRARKVIRKQYLKLETYG